MSVREYFYSISNRNSVRSTYHLSIAQTASWLKQSLIRSACCSRSYALCRLGQKKISEQRVSVHLLYFMFLINVRVYVRIGLKVGYRFFVFSQRNCKVQPLPFNKCLIFSITYLQKLRVPLSEISCIQRLICTGRLELGQDLNSEAVCDEAFFLGRLTRAHWRPQSSSVGRAKANIQIATTIVRLQLLRKILNNTSTNNVMQENVAGRKISPGRKMPILYPAKVV